MCMRVYNGLFLLLLACEYLLMHQLLELSHNIACVLVELLGEIYSQVLKVLNCVFYLRIIWSDHSCCWHSC
jgi:hypothetical protein